MNASTTQTAPVTISNVVIQQRHGLYSLNDLHKASGGEVKHQPTRFIRLDTTQALIAEISSSPDMVNIPVEVVRGRGKAQGTYACRELVIAYAAWISAAFHLQVIRVFLDSLEAAEKPVPTRTLTFTIPCSEQHSARWLLDIDHQGNERAQPLAPNTHVLTRERLLRVLIQNPADLYLTLEERFSVLAAILRTLNQSVGLVRHKLQLNSIEPPALVKGADRQYRLPVTHQAKALHNEGLFCALRENPPVRGLYLRGLTLQIPRPIARRSPPLGFLRLCRRSPLTVSARLVPSFFAHRLSRRQRV